MSNELASDELRDEYQFDYSQAKPNRFAAPLKRDGDAAEDRSKLASRGRGDGVSMEDNLRKLREAAATFARDRESAEAKVSHINPTIDQLCKTKMLAVGHTIVGQVVHSVGYGESETAQYFAAGIQGDGGIGAFEYWIGFGEEPDEFATYKFVPFAQCPPVAQARLAGQIDDLMSRLMWELGVHA